MMSRTESMPSSSTQQIKLKLDEAECPYCGSLAKAEFGKGQQISPFTCTNQECQAIEIGEMDEDRGMSEQEWNTGWWEPMREPPERRDCGTNGFFLEDTERDAFRLRNELKTPSVSEIRDCIDKSAFMYERFQDDPSTRAVFLGPHDHHYHDKIDVKEFINRYDRQTRSRTPCIEQELASLVTQIIDRCNVSGEVSFNRLLINIVSALKFSRRTVDSLELINLILYKAQEELAHQKSRPHKEQYVLRSDK